MHGTSSVTPTGVSYQPSAGYFGTDTFTYTVTDGAGVSKTATVTVSVIQTPTAVDDGPVRTIIFACDAGMGSSAMGAPVLRNKIKKAGFADVDVQNVAIANLTDDVDLIVTHQDLTPRARTMSPSAQHVSVDNFMNSPQYDAIVEELRTTNAHGAGTSR